mmetsp:Transcript_3200/g.3722  ORF Transcript_3200/g.3722 Transcript_3200/m.3722 type:complete len:173 (-) Transcript_3200:336-854(-)
MTLEKPYHKTTSLRRPQQKKSHRLNDKDYLFLKRIFILLINGTTKCFAIRVFLKLVQPVDAVNLTSSATPLKGRKIGSFSSSSYSNANVAAACIAASASTSHLALLTDAAAAKSDEREGKNETSKTLDMAPVAPPILLTCSNHGNSTIAAVAAAQRELSALVNGKIAALRAP